MRPTDQETPTHSSGERAEAFAAPPLGDLELDGPGELREARSRDGLMFCPHCHCGIASSPEFAGQVVKCPQCGQSFLMPETVQLGFHPAPTYASHTHRPDFSSKEPWFYRFIETYANIWLWLSLLFFVGLIAGVLGVWSQVVGNLPPGQKEWSLLAIPVMVVIFVPAFIGILLSVAFMRLAVDMARNLREIRLRSSK